MTEKSLKIIKRSFCALGCERYIHQRPPYVKYKYTIYYILLNKLEVNSFGTPAEILPTHLRPYLHE